MIICLLALTETLFFLHLMSLIRPPVIVGDSLVWPDKESFMQ